jgi:hypothetical protein
MHGVIVPVNSQLNHWQAVCWCWISHFEYFCQMANYGDAPHVYLEDGNTHFLSIAATQCGYATMREIYGTRLGVNARLGLRFFNNYESNLTEAEWSEINGSIVVPFSRLQNKLNDVCKEVHVYRNNTSSLFFASDRCIRRVGVLFITP